jgi:diguanylate cyclase (GGDEF)-like protein
MPSLVDALLTQQPRQRERLAQALLAMALLAAGVLAMGYFVLIGVAPARPVTVWAALTLAGMTGFYGLIRSGVSLRWRDPSLTVPQMLFALTSGAVAYTLLGAGRGAVFPVVMVVLMFGMFVATPQQMRGVCLYAVLAFGVAMGWRMGTDPARYPRLVELGHFLLVATMMPAVAVLAERLARLRQRSRLQRSELEQALARLREQTTRDELTGLPNRRHMRELLEQEHQRCVRSGQTFCVALVDVDRMRAVNDAHGHEAGDMLLLALVDEAMRQVRACDRLSRHGGDELLLLMTDTRASLARGGVERLRERLAAVRLPGAGGAPLAATVSVGLAEHHAGETVEQTLERAQAALEEAKVQGRDCVVLAP